jgi:hypothetical protein
MDVRWVGVHPPVFFNDKWFSRSLFLTVAILSASSFCCAAATSTPPSWGAAWREVSLPTAVSSSSRWPSATDPEESQNWPGVNAKAHLRDVLLKGKAQYSWAPCTYYFRSPPFYTKNIVYLFPKQATLMRRSTALSFSPQLVFPAHLHWQSLPQKRLQQQQWLYLAWLP